MWWELCNGTSEYLIDLYGDGDAPWQKAKQHFRAKGYYGDFLLIHRSKTGFKLYKINIYQ